MGVSWRFLWLWYRCVKECKVAEIFCDNVSSLSLQHRQRCKKRLLLKFSSYYESIVALQCTATED